MTASQNYIARLRIDSLAFGGSGVGRHQGRVAFVPLTAPGDIVRCEVVRNKKRFLECRMIETIEPAASRIEPACPHFGECGGCQWQHLPYAVQCQWKEEIFRDFLVRKGGADPNTVQPLAASPQAWGYRSRAQFKCRHTPAGFLVGFYRRGSHYVIPVAQCPILHPALNRVKEQLRICIGTSRWAACVSQIDLAVDDRNRVRAVIHFLGSDQRAFAEYLRTSAEAHDMAVFIQSGRKSRLQHVWGPAELIVEVGTPPLHLGYGPGGFAQINLAQNRAMVREVVDLLTSDPPQRVLDLFCGMGNFSLPLARVAREVVGVEGFAPSIAMAEQNAAQNGIANARFLVGDCSGAATAFSRDIDVDLVILDPPRSGAYNVAKELVKVLPARILYVSCDPSTLVRDLQPLLHNGYRLLRSRPFDLFPQTHHIESVTLLERI